MDVEEFDRLPVARAREALRACADVDSWVELLASGRPYASAGALLAVADAAARHWEPSEVEKALADHPRIGERHAGTGASAAMSAREQSGVGRGDALAEGNRRYEERFGRVFLVRAAGRDADEILAELRRRLDNDPDEELRETAAALREIAVLRLRGLVGA